MLYLFLALNLFFVQPTSYEVENWYFEEQFSYGDNEEELLYVGSQVIKVATNYYILDSGLSTVIELSQNGSWKEYLVEGEGPGECSRPNSLIKEEDGFALLNSFEPSVIYTDLEKKVFPKTSTVVQNSFFARNLLSIEDGEYFLLNLLQKGEYPMYTISVVDKEGEILHNFLELERNIGDDFPIWFYRNSWTTSSDKLAIITDYNYSVTVFNVMGKLESKIEGPKDSSAQKENVLGASLQGVFYAGDTLLVLAFNSNEILEFHAPAENKIIRVDGVRASNLAQYFWLDRDTLAVMYGWTNSVFHTTDEEDHIVTFFKRSKS